MTIGGIPLLYFGDEVGTLNDYSYRSDPSKEHDSRWVHRPQMDWKKVDLRNDPATIEGRVYQGLKSLIKLRQSEPVFSGHETEIIDCNNPHIFGFLRNHLGERMLVLANFNETMQKIPANLLRLYGLGYQFVDLLSGKETGIQDLELRPFQLVCLKAG